MGKRYAEHINEYFDSKAIAARFLEAGRDIDRNIAQFVYSKLKNYDENHEKGHRQAWSDRV